MMFVINTDLIWDRLIGAEANSNFREWRCDLATTRLLKTHVRGIPDPEADG